MITQLAVGMIVAICQGNVHLYKVQDYNVDCIEFYTSCVVNHVGSHKTATTKQVEECQDESETKIVK